MLKNASSCELTCDLDRHRAVANGARTQARRSGREAEGGGLENHWPARARRFESCILRQRFRRLGEPAFAARRPPGGACKCFRVCVYVTAMDADVLQKLFPIVGVLAMFGFPVALVFIWKWFKLKDKELQLEAETRKTAGRAMEARMQRVESIILALDSDLRAKLGAGPTPRTELFDAPAAPESSEANPLLGSPGKTRE